MAETNHHLPAEDQSMRDLLIRLDEKVKSGFETTNKKLDAIDERLGRHEQRIHALELDNADRPMLKAQFEVAKASIADHQIRLSTIETATKASGSTISWILRIVPVVITVVSLISGFVYLKNEAAKKPDPAPVVQYHPAPAVIPPR